MRAKCIRTTHPNAKLDADIMPTLCWEANSPIECSSCSLSPVDPETHRTPWLIQVRMAVAAPSALVKSTTTSGFTILKSSDNSFANGSCVPLSVSMVVWDVVACISTPPTGIMPFSCSTAFSTVKPIRPNAPFTATLISVISLRTCYV